jgi:four helix bundle protein
MKEYYRSQESLVGSLESEQKTPDNILKKLMGQYKDLLAYQKGYELAMKIFILSKKFPPEEKFSLTDQIRRSSRSVCTNLAEAFRRKRYKDYFINKLNDSETENAETEVWLAFAKDCSYLDTVEYRTSWQSEFDLTDFFYRDKTCPAVLSRLQFPFRALSL